MGTLDPAYVKGTPEYEARLYKGPPPDIDLRRVEPKKSDGKDSSVAIYINYIEDVFIEIFCSLLSNTDCLFYSDIFHI